MYNRQKDSFLLEAVKGSPYLKWPVSGELDLSPTKLVKTSVLCFVLFCFS